jgi:hypothetical protein
MAAQFITTDDLYVFKLELLSEIKSLIATNANFQNQKKWLKSNEVRKLLKISPGTLQNFRINGTLSFTKIGSIFYYDYNEIEKLLTNNKIDSTSPPNKPK